MKSLYLPLLPIFAAGHPTALSEVHKRQSAFRSAFHRAFAVAAVLGFGLLIESNGAAYGQDLTGYSRDQFRSLNESPYHIGADVAYTLQKIEIKLSGLRVMQGGKPGRLGILPLEFEYDALIKEAILVAQIQSDEAAATTLDQISSAESWLSSVLPQAGSTAQQFSSALSKAQRQASSAGREDRASLLGKLSSLSTSAGNASQRINSALAGLSAATDGLKLFVTSAAPLQCYAGAEEGVRALLDAGGSALPSEMRGALQDILAQIHGGQQGFLRSLGDSPQEVLGIANDLLGTINGDNGDIFANAAQKLLGTDAFGKVTEVQKARQQLHDWLNNFTHFDELDSASGRAMIPAFADVEIDPVIFQGMPIAGRPMNNHFLNALELLFRIQAINCERCTDLFNMANHSGFSIQQNNIEGTKVAGSDALKAAAHLHGLLYGAAE